MGIFDLVSNKREILKQDKEQRYFLNDIVNIVLPEFQAGKIYYMNTLLKVFGMPNEQELQKKIAQAFVQYLDACSVKKLIRLDEECRKSYYGADFHDKVQLDWNVVQFSRERFPNLSDKEYSAVLRFGTCHSNGYFRQMCMEQLAGYEGSLPYLIIRMNDWVKLIREQAFLHAQKVILNCSVTELFSAFPMVNKVQNSGRREKDNIDTIEKLIYENIIEKFHACILDDIINADITVKNAVYHFLKQNKALSFKQMNELLTREKTSYGKGLLIEGIFKHFDCGQEQLNQYLSDKYTVVRYHALEYKYRKCKEIWSGMEELLLDKSRKIREFVVYLYTKYTEFDVLGYYKEQLQKSNIPMAMMGIGENGTIQDVEYIFPYLDDDNEQIVKIALKAYGKLKRDGGEEIYWKFLLSESRVLSVQAYRLIRKYNVQYGAKYLFETYMKYVEQPVAEYLVLLIIKEPSWERLPYLIQLYDCRTLSDSTMILVRTAVGMRYEYARVTQLLKEEILHAVEMKKSCLPEELVKGILFDLKWVN